MGWLATANFYEQLRMLLKSGIPLGQALPLVHERASAPYKHWLPDLIEDSNKGVPLSEGLRRKGEKAFPLALFTAGERSGHLPEMCAEIVAFYEHAMQVRRMVIARSIYPLVLLHCATVIPALVFVFLGRAPAWAPLIGPLLIWGVIGGLFLIWHFGKQAGIMAKLGTLPVLKSVVRPMVAANTCLILHSGVVSGMMFPEMLHLAADGCGNRSWGERLHKAGQDLQHDRLRDLTTALGTTDMPREVLELCRTGEESGELEQAMKRAAAFQRERFMERVNWAAKIFTGLIFALGMLTMVGAIIYLFATTVGKAYGDAMDFMNEATSFLN